jgi:uncharacterized membrane protein
MNIKPSVSIIGLAALAAGGLLLFRQTKVRVHTGPQFAVDKAMDVQVPLGKALTAVAAVAISAMLLPQARKTRVFSRPGMVEQSIDVNVPVSTAYNQWTQFEQFPKFMETVQEVRQVDDTHLHWRANVAGKTKEWDSEITEQIPDQKIAWHSTSGPRNAGVVTFDKIGDNKTRVMLQMEYQPESADEKVGGLLGGVKLTAKANLKRFKELVERRGVETGAWRGTVAQQH